MDNVPALRLALIMLFSLHSDAFTCGRSLVDEGIFMRIIGGTEAKRYAWPWMVVISSSSDSDHRRTPRQKSDQSICSGVVLDREWVLTSAHCVADAKSMPSKGYKNKRYGWKVTAGVLNRDKRSPLSRHWQQREVTRILIHPEFRMNRRHSVNDIALMQLDDPLMFSGNVRPLCMPYGKVPRAGSRDCKVAGWGVTEKKGKRPSMILNEVDVPIINDYSCAKAYPGLIDRKQHLCAGAWIYGRKDSCYGDSGGPLTCRVADGSWYMAGMVSWGEGCGRRRKPGVYVKVSNYERWLLWCMYYHSRLPNDYWRRLSLLSTWWHRAAEDATN